MMDIMQDDDGVILNSAGDLVLDGGIDGIAQQCEIRVSTNRQEWWLDVTQGLPWFYGIFGQKLDAALVGRMIAAEGVNTEGVTKITVTRAVMVAGRVSVLFDVYVGQDKQEVSI
ncbi:hypothetical protein JGY68_002146 [Salmonella enterica]|nr:hypothetical protein [Salmonella enterica]EEI3459137.1 hypothetical protein [Salmonella enterica subsp. salamae]EGH5309447.1 hypothetical protein [Salmonella enterica]EGW8385403.1 hypothetical protein [Salmonella enterica]EHL2428948.1 hypothetical protein [Salmonella enterica]